MKTEVLNLVVSKLRASGIKVENTADAKNAIISLCVVTLVEAGADVKDAMNAVMGEGHFERIANSVWEAHNARSESTISDMVLLGLMEDVYSDES